MTARSSTCPSALSSRWSFQKNWRLLPILPSQVRLLRLVVLLCITVLHHANYIGKTHTHSKVVVEQFCVFNHISGGGCISHGTVPDGLHNRGHTWTAGATPAARHPVWRDHHQLGAGRTTQTRPETPRHVHLSYLLYRDRVYHISG